MSEITNETLRTIMTRRSIRKYKPDPIPSEILKAILFPGIYAPTAMGRQPWYVVVIQNRKTIDELNDQVKAATARMPDNPYRDYVGSENYTIHYGAPTFVIATGDCELAPRSAEVDCALLLGTTFLAAHSLGIGSCWINQLNVLNDEPEFREYMTTLTIPKQNRIFGCACFGYADGPPPKPIPKKEYPFIILE